MLIPFLVLLGLLALVPTILWGFPGPWALTAIVPAFIAAATFRHVRVPKAERQSTPAGPGETPQPGPVIRPGVVVLGGLFSLVTGAASLILMWAVNAPSTIVISAETIIPADRARVWSVIVDLPKRTDWNPWIAGTEPIGRGGPIAVGSAYRATLALERYTVPGELTVTTFEPEVRFAWDVKPVAESKVIGMAEAIALVRDDDVTTRVRYQLSYEVPTVLGRVAERIAMRGSVERLAEAIVDQLRQKVLGPR